MVENDKVFVMNRPDKIGARSERSPLLTFMHKKTEFWTRQQVENIIDMSQV